MELIKTGKTKHGEEVEGGENVRRGTGRVLPVVSTCPRRLISDSGHSLLR